MLKAEPLIGVARYRWVSQRHDKRHLHQPMQGRLPYQERLSRLLIEVLIMIFGKVVHPAFEQFNYAIGGMRGHCSRTERTAVGSWVSGWFRPFLTFYDGQLNFLPVLKPDFRERFEDPILVESLKGFCHGQSQRVEQLD